MYQLHQGDCLAVLATMPDASVDAIVTDPPYGLKFMGKGWDYDVPSVKIWAECLRVLKPGGHLLAFAGTRTQHRMACRIEDAGFELRDMVTYLYDTNETARALVESLTPDQLKLLDATFGRDSMVAWSYGTGFPKSMDVSKAIDKAAGAEREVIGGYRFAGKTPNSSGKYHDSHNVMSGATRHRQHETAPATDEANQWQGWGTALKPALEPITVARKPFKGTVAANVLAHGTGALNIDGSRVGNDIVSTHSRGANGAFPKRPGETTAEESGRKKDQREGLDHSERTGRWPANLIHDGSDEVVALFPAQAGAAAQVKGTEPSAASTGKVTGKCARVTGVFHGDSGSASRFFYCAKASRQDRHEGMEDPTATKGNNHPTVKPTDLMRYLCRLVTPPGGVVLDPFMGSGSTGKAALREGFTFIGIEREADYVALAEARLAAELPPEQDKTGTN